MPGIAVETSVAFSPPAIERFGGLSTYGANKLGGLVFGGTAFTQPTCYAQPNELQPIEAGTGADTPDNGYSARVALTFGAAASRSVSMASATALYAATGVEELDSVAIFDASSAGNLLALAVPSSIHTTVNGQSVVAYELELNFTSSAMRDVLANALLAHLCGGSAYTPETDLQIGLISSGTTELSGNGYSRITVDNDGTTWDAWAAGQTENLIDFTWGPATSGNWAQATRFGIWSGDGSTLLWVDALTNPITVTVGNYARILAGNLRLQLPAAFGQSLAEPLLDTWYDVTAAGMDMADTVGGNESFGVQDIIVDPARPQDLYAFICFQGVWKSTDYGKTWAKVSTTPVIETGKLWSACIDPNTGRNPTTPPTMWTLNGIGSTQGVFKSTDGGITWTNQLTGGPSEDVYCLAIDPYDSAHLLVTYHGDPQVYESFNAGVSWAIGGVSPANGVSGYVFFIDTGSGATTADTWVHMAQNGEGLGLRRTTNGGTSWSTVISGASHPHGGCQIAQWGAGNVVVASAGQGIYESTDYGASFTLVDASQTGIGFACNTAEHVWVWNSFPSHAGDSHRLRNRPIGGGSYTALVGVDADMTNGGKNIAVTLKGGRTVLVSGNWQAGIWRWVEP